MDTQRNRRPPSMADVAAVAGVSHQTVSRVINNKGVVRPETRERVIEAIARLGYRRNEQARTLATRRSKMLGIITPNFSHYGPASTLLAVQLAAAAKGYIASVAALAELSADSLHHALDTFLGQNVAGIIVVVPVTQMAIELDQFSIPVPTIAIASAWVSPDSGIVRVGVEQRSGVRDAMRLLRERGCRSVAHFAGPEDWFDAREREAAWREALAETGMEEGPLLRGAWSAPEGYAMARQLMQGDLPDAVFVGNDQMSLGALRAFGEAGVRVPEDLRLVGYDDEDGSMFFNPSLTTVRQDFHSLGSVAIDTLIQRLDGTQVRDQMIPASLQARQSA